MRWALANDVVRKSRKWTLTRVFLLLLATVIDVFSRRVVGWSMDDHQRIELTERALDMA